MKVHAIIAVYNDSMFLSATLQSLANHVDSIIIADGAYAEYYKTYKEHFPRAQPWSTDGTLELIQALPDLPELHIMRCKEPWENQNIKRNALVKAVPDGDWFIVIAADEMLTGKIDEGLKDIIDSGCVAGHIPLYNVGLDIDRLYPYWHARIYEKMPGMFYYGTHWHLRDQHHRVVEAAYPLAWSEKFVMVHFKWLKTTHRLLPHQEYMLKLKEVGWIEPKADETLKEVKQWETKL